MTRMRSLIERLEEAKTMKDQPEPYKIGQRFQFKVGDRVICNGYPGEVERVVKERGSVEVRLERGHVEVPASYPDCYPDKDGSDLSRSDVKSVGEPKKEDEPAPRGRNLPDSWRITQMFRVGKDRYQVRTSWKGIPWDEREQVNLVNDMRGELWQQLRTGHSRLQSMGANLWVLP
jgi:hypothetical protein